MHDELSQPEWYDEAQCRGTDFSIFFPDNEKYSTLVAIAKSVCGPCPVRAKCLQYALDSKQPMGVWGGMTTSERNRLVRRQRRESVA